LAKPVRWLLFIDESGQFDRLSDDVVVAGIMLHRDIPGTSPEELRASLQALGPDLQWPFHAAYLNLPVLLPLSRHVRRQRDVAAPPATASDDLDTLTETVINVLHERQPHKLLRTLEALKKNREPDFQNVRDLNGELQASNNKVYVIFNDHMREMWAGVGRLVGMLEKGAAQIADDQPAVMLFASGEACKGAAMPREWSGLGPGLASRRYLTLLQSALERVADVLSSRTGSHQVQVQVLGRSVMTEVLGARLKTADILPVKRKEPREVDVVPEKVAVFDEQVHPALVIADFVANRCRWVLRNNLALRQVEQRINKLVGVAVRSAGRSHLAAIELTKCSRVRPWAQDLVKEWR